MYFLNLSDVFFSSGENGNVEYYEEFPIRLVHQFEGICFAIVLSPAMTVHKVFKIIESSLPLCDWL